MSNNEKKELLEKLVVSIAKKYVGRGVEYQELYDTGISVIPIILDRYKDKDIDLKFDNIPSFYIRQAITRKIIDNSKD